jgi:hypothetical protein
MGNRLKWSLAICVVVGLPLFFARGSCPLAARGDDAPAPSEQVLSSETGPGETSSKEPDVEEGFIDPMGPNAACYVCHMTFVYEELALVHLPEKVTCIKCHGTSGPHANDENIGATKPDITYPRAKIDAHCAECHETHDAPAREVIARWLEIERPDGEPVCTDCHGMHKISEAQLVDVENAESP